MTTTQNTNWQIVPVSDFTVMCWLILKYADYVYLKMHWAGRVNGYLRTPMYQDSVIACLLPVGVLVLAIFLTGFATVTYTRIWLRRLCVKLNRKISCLKTPYILHSVIQTECFTVILLNRQFCWASDKIINKEANEAAAAIVLCIITTYSEYSSTVCL